MITKVTVFLKSGGSTFSIHPDKTLQETIKFYGKALNDNKIKGLVVNGDNLTQIIPIDNIAAVEIEEVEK